LGSAIDALSWQDAIDRIIGWASAYESRYVCACNAHTLVTASLDPQFRDVINGADMAVPDGMPIAWSLTQLGLHRQDRISGPDLMLRVCDGAAQHRVKVFLYGSAPKTLARLTVNLKHCLPKLDVVGTHAPPYRDLTAEEDEDIVDLINASGAAIVFVGLGCPKQERWMAEHRGRINAVMLGVGAAFDFHAGTIRRAPRWMQHSGLEWLFRLLQEPTRLWRRYLTTNTIFLVQIAKQFLRDQQPAVNAAPEEAQANRSAGPDGESSDAPKIEEPTR
jgi:N-acetylglucosaminyldiphosphoundecaprenol N-acetyl-beta-D-mannosaminyltransferase